MRQIHKTCSSTFSSTQAGRKRRRIGPSFRPTRNGKRGRPNRKCRDHLWITSIDTSWIRRASQHLSRNRNLTHQPAMPYVTVGKENGANIDIYYEDHGSGASRRPFSWPLRAFLCWPIPLV